jgi:hypothetical protein
MKTCTIIFALITSCVAVSAATPAKPAPAKAASPVKPGVHARAQYHPDNSRTESISYPATRELEEKTYDANGVLQMRKHYLLNEQGQPSQGNIYDGKNNLVARSMLLFDDYGRAKEMRTANLQGEVFQQVIYEYDANNKAKTPKVINHNVKMPTFRPAAIDFTQSTPPPSNLVPSMNGASQQSLIQNNGAVIRQEPIYAPGAEPAGTEPAEAPKKKSFWKRLFSKDK